MPFNTSTVNVGGSAPFRYLQQQIPTYLKQRRGNLLYEDGTIVPYLGDLASIGNRTVNQGKILETGEAVISAPGTYDAPLVEVSVREDEYRIFKSEIGFRVGYDEMMAFEAAALNGFAVGSAYNLKFEAALRAIRERLDKTIAYGIPALSVTGAINSPDVPDSTPSFQPYLAAGIDGIDLFEFMMEPISDIDEETESVEGSNATTYEVSSKLYNLLERTIMGTTVGGGAGVTVLQQLRGLGKTVIKSRRLDEARLVENGVFDSGDNLERFVLHPRDPDVLGRMGFAPRLYPEDLARRDGNSTIFMMHAYTTEAVIRRPLAMRYVDYSTATT